MTNRYVILARNGYEFVSEGVEYAVYQDNKLIFLNWNKARVEECFWRYVNNGK